MNDDNKGTHVYIVLRTLSLYLQSLYDQCVVDDKIIGHKMSYAGKWTPMPTWAWNRIMLYDENTWLLADTMGNI